MRGGNSLVVIHGRYLEKRGYISLIQKKKDEWQGTGVYYECPKCGKTTETFKALKHHRKEVHAY